MSPQEVELALRRWGWVHGEQPDRELPETARAPAVHPIARAMEFAHRGKDKRISVAYRRLVREGEKAWSRDPVPCIETQRAAGRAPEAPSPNDPVELVQRAWLSLTRHSWIVAEAVRLEYQVRDGQRGKAQRMALSVNRYRELLAEGRGWITAQLCRAA